MEDSTIIEMYFARDENAISETDKKYGEYCRAIAWNILSSRQTGLRLTENTGSATS